MDMTIEVLITEDKASWRKAMVGAAVEKALPAADGRSSAAYAASQPIEAAAPSVMLQLSRCCSARTVRSWPSHPCGGCRGAAQPETVLLPADDFSACNDKTEPTGRETAWPSDRQRSSSSVNAAFHVQSPPSYEFMTRFNNYQFLIVV